MKSPLIVLGMIFVVLKLIGEIDWSWWWVTSPFWIFLILLTVLAVIKEYERTKRPPLLRSIIRNRKNRK